MIIFPKKSPYVYLIHSFEVAYQLLVFVCNIRIVLFLRYEQFAIVILMLKKSSKLNISLVNFYTKINYSSILSICYIAATSFQLKIVTGIQ